LTAKVQLEYDEFTGLLVQAQSILSQVVNLIVCELVNLIVKKRIRFPAESSFETR